MLLWLFLTAALLLSIERIAYLWIWHHPDTFKAVCKYPAIVRFGEPISALEKLFYIFKILQIGIFLAWCMLLGNTLIPLPTSSLVPMSLGIGLIVIGQVFNFGVFYRLGRSGVFYGNKFGYEIQWCNAFPFSVLNHPQYVGTLLSIWGFFLVMRFPHDDWILLPLVETLYYGVGAYYER